MRNRQPIDDWCNRVFAGLFLLIVFLPAVLAIWPWEISSPSLTEKRRLAQRPAIPNDIHSLVTYPQRFDRFFDDHFPLRKLLIQRYNHLRIKIMKQSDQRNVLMGREGWLFYTQERQLRDFIGQASFSEDKLTALQNLLEARRDWLAARGMAYLFVIPPGKPSIYPEYMPHSYLQARGRTRLDQFMDHMRAHSDVTIVDLRASLLTAKAQHLLYHRHDSHWNTIGSMVAYGEIMRAVSRALGRDMGYPRTWKDFTIDHRDRQGGDLTDMLSLSAHFTENEAYLIPQGTFKPCARKEKREGYLGRDWIAATEPFTMHCARAEIDLVMFRDSFGSELVPYLSEHFRRSTYIWKWNYDADLFKAVIEKEAPQIVIDECGERMLYYLETGAAQRPDL